MMSTAPEHPLLEFASKYGDPSQDYFTAYVAIARLASLTKDLAATRELLEAEWPPGRRYYPWFGAEIISYYAVGFVTCLEWHAKSRLKDLLTYQPSALRVEDVKGTISDKLIVQMVAQQASVTQLVCASVRVSSAEKYFRVIGRVFTGLEMPFSLTDWLTGEADSATVCWIRPGQLAQLDRLFEFRHQLVHEVGISVMGHPNVRDSWSPAQAEQMSGLVASIIYGIEAAFTRYAPRLFPNLLTEDQWPVSPVTTLGAELARLDALTDAQIAAGEWENQQTVEAWAEARARFRDYMEAEERFIDTADMLHWRYFDARTPLRLRLIQYRLGFLHELLSHFGTAAGDNPNLRDEQARDCGVTPLN